MRLRPARVAGTGLQCGMTADRLRIGVLASIAHRPPPARYGPWEQVASTLTEGLVARGHEVTLFATADSTTAARLHAAAPDGYEEDAGVDAKAGRRCTSRPPSSGRPSSTCSPTSSTSCR